MLGSIGTGYLGNSRSRDTKFSCMLLALQPGLQANPMNMAQDKLFK